MLLQPIIDCKPPVSAPSSLLLLLLLLLLFSQLCCSQGRLLCQTFSHHTLGGEKLKVLHLERLFCFLRPNHLGISYTCDKNFRIENDYKIFEELHFSNFHNFIKIVRLFSAAVSINGLNLSISIFCHKLSLLIFVK